MPTSTYYAVLLALVLGVGCGKGKEIDSLKNENKRLRVELQNLKDITARQAQEREDEETMALADKKKSLSKKQPKFIVITVQEDGGLTLRGDEVKLESLEAALKLEYRSDPDAKVLVRGHVKAHFGKVANVFLISKNAGFLKATIGYDAVQ